MSGAPHIYRKLVVDEISFVDEGASPGARVAIYKRRDGVEKSAMNLDQILSTMPEEQKNAILAALDAAQKAGMEAGKLAAAAQPPAPPAPEAPEGPEVVVEAAKPEQVACADQPPPPAAKPDPMAEEMKKRLDAERSEVAKAKAEAESLRKRLDEITDRDEQREYVAKAKAMPLPTLDESELGTVLRSVAKGRVIPEALAKKFETALGAISTAIAKSKLFDEVGASGANDDGSPKSKLEAIAKSLKAADPQLSDAAAFTKAAEANPKLYEEARAQR